MPKRTDFCLIFFGCLIGFHLSLMANASLPKSGTDITYIGHHVEGGSLYANLQLSGDFTNEGALNIPDGVKKIWIEIGANSRNLAQSIINGDESLEDVMLLTFEPLMDKYGAIASLGTVPDTRRRVGHQSSNGKMLVFPFAVSETSGVSKFYVSDVDGCSSLLSMKAENYSHPNPGWQNFAASCAKAQEIRIVPTIAFTEVLDTWLQGREVDWVKIDAQGFDVQLVQAAGESRKQLKKISMEAVKDTCDVMYEGALKCADMYSIMIDLGFLSNITCDSAIWDGAAGCESEEFHWGRNVEQF